MQFLCLLPYPLYINTIQKFPGYICYKWNKTKTLWHLLCTCNEILITSLNISHSSYTQICTIYIAIMNDDKFHFSFSLLHASLCLMLTKSISIKQKKNIHKNHAHKLWPIVCGFKPRFWVGKSFFRKKNINLHNVQTIQINL